MAVVLNFFKFSNWTEFLKLAINVKYGVIVTDLEFVKSIDEIQSDMFDIMLGDIQSKALNSNRSVVKSMDNLLIRRLKIVNIEQNQFEEKAFDICLIGLDIPAREDSICFPSIPEMRNKVLCSFNDI